MIDHAHLRLFQFCDSQFPTGAFSHSFGLETYIQRDTVHDEESFQQWLVLFLNEQLTYADGLTMRLVYDALNENDTKAILKLDRILLFKTYQKKRDKVQNKWEIAWLNLRLNYMIAIGLIGIMPK